MARSPVPRAVSCGRGESCPGTVALCTASSFPRSDGPRKHRSDRSAIWRWISTGYRVWSLLCWGTGWPDRVTYYDGHFGRQNPLVDMPWTQWLTWPLQAVPTFFLAAGYAGAVSWAHRRDTDGVSRQTWLRHRLARVLGPDRGVRRAGVGGRGSAGRVARGRFHAGICGLGGGDAPVVPRRLPHGGRR